MFADSKPQGQAEKGPQSSYMDTMKQRLQENVTSMVGYCNSLCLVDIFQKYVECFIWEWPQNLIEYFEATCIKNIVFTDN